MGVRSEIAVLLLKALSALRLHRDHTSPDEMRKAYRQVRQEEADTLAGKPFVLTAQPTKEEQKKVLLWMQAPAKKNQLSRKDKRQIDPSCGFFGGHPGHHGVHEAVWRLF